MIGEALRAARRHALGSRYGGLGELYAACVEGLAALERIERVMETHQMALFVMEPMEGVAADGEGTEKIRFDNVQH